MAATIYRLECSECDASHDGVKKIPRGWTRVGRVQSLRDSRRVRARPGEVNFSLLDWSTHMGLCPDCTKQEAAE